METVTRARRRCRSQRADEPHRPPNRALLSYRPNPVAPIRVAGPMTPGGRRAPAAAFLGRRSGGGLSLSRASTRADRAPERRLPMELLVRQWLPRHHPRRRPDVRHGLLPHRPDAAAQATKASVQATETRHAAHLHVASFRPRGPQQPRLGLLAKAALTAFNDALSLGANLVAAFRGEQRPHGSV